MLNKVTLPVNFKVQVDDLVSKKWKRSRILMEHYTLSDLLFCIPSLRMSQSFLLIEADYREIQGVK